MECKAIDVDKNTLEDANTTGEKEAHRCDVVELRNMHLSIDI